MRHLLSVVVLSVLLVPATADAQSAADSIRAQARADSLRRDSVEQVLISPPTVPLYGNAPRAFATVGPGDEKSTVTLSSGFRLVDVGLPSFTAKLEATAPVEEGSKEPTTFGGLKGLGDGTNLSLGVQWTTRERGTPSRPSEDVEWCTRTKERAARANQPDPLAGLDCIDDIDLTAVRARGDSIYADYLFRTGWREPWIFAVATTLGRSSNKHLDPISYQPAKMDRVSYSAGVDVGRLFGASLWSVGVGYKVNYKAHTKAEICAPVLAGALQCRSGPLGPPDLQRGAVVNLQNRSFFGRFGANPILSYDFAEDGFAVHVPFFFARDKDGSLIGGIAPGYQSRVDEDESRWSLRLFVGASALGLGL